MTVKWVSDLLTGHEGYLGFQILLNESRDPVTLMFANHDDAKRMHAEFKQDVNNDDVPTQKI